MRMLRFWSVFRYFGSHSGNHYRQGPFAIFFLPKIKFFPNWLPPKWKQWSFPHINNFCPNFLHQGLPSEFNFPSFQQYKPNPLSYLWYHFSCPDTSPHHLEANSRCQSPRHRSYGSFRGPERQIVSSHHSSSSWVVLFNYYRLRQNKKVKILDYHSLEGCNAEQSRRNSWWFLLLLFNFAFCIC